MGFYPDNVNLYEEAFLHKSSSRHSGKNLNNERLEFLGDAILDAVIADILYKHFPKHDEGYLTNTRSKIVQREHLTRLATEVGISKMVIYSTKLSHNNYLYGNAFEAFIGAIYLDKGYRKCYRFIEEKVISKYVDLDKIARKQVNFKSSLIEWCQKRKLEVKFNLVETTVDKDGSPLFQSEVILLERQISIGTGYSKKESEQQASKVALKKLRADKKIADANIPEKKANPNSNKS